MKKILFICAVAIAMSATFAGCSKGTDLYDENAVEQKKVQDVQNAYRAAFIKEFGSISPNQDWGFGSSRAETRAVYYLNGFGEFEMPAVLQNSEGKNYDQLFNAASDATTLPQALIDGNYILQHVDKSTYKGGTDGTGTSSEHQKMEYLEAYNFETGKWEKVENFVKGKNVKSIKDDNKKKMTKGCTLMYNMGTPGANAKIFRWIDKNGNACDNYRIRIINGEYYLGLGYSNNNTTDYDAWIIKIVSPEIAPDFIARGRIFCEDLGLGGDIDFNDCVFDATIMKDGYIYIDILAAGGQMDITVAGVKVTLGHMKNTGEGEPVATQSFRVPANGINNLRDIPVIVKNGTQEYELTADYGEAPGKICTYINVPWPDEYISIKKAYTDFESWVRNAAPNDWFLNGVDELIDHRLDNNK